MISKTAFTLHPQRYIGEGRGMGEILQEIGRKLINVRTFRGYRWFGGRGIYHIPSSSTKCCNMLLEKLEDLRLVKVKSFKWEGRAAKAYLYINKGKYLEYKITHFNRALYDLKPKIKVSNNSL
jgi:hypothetical protein